MNDLGNSGDPRMVLIQAALAHRTGRRNRPTFGMSKRRPSRPFLQDPSGEEFVGGGRRPEVEDTGFAPGEMAALPPQRGHAGLPLGAAPARQQLDQGSLIEHLRVLLGGNTRSDQASRMNNPDSIRQILLQLIQGGGAL